MNKTKLSICIPTYNRERKLNISLNRILEESSRFINQVEVIVSDNASNDNSKKVIQDLSIKYPHLIHYRNEENLGFNKNFEKLVYYASGDFIWILGDDDLLDFGAIERILDIINDNEDAKLISLNFRVLPFDDAVIYFREKESEKYIITKSSESIDKQSRVENILATFMSCNIVRKECFSDFDYSKFSKESWDNYYSLFPHSYILSKNISPNSTAIYLPSPILTVISDCKNWDDKLPELHLKFIIQLLKYYKRNGYINMVNTNEKIIEGGILCLFKKNINFTLRFKFFLYAINKSMFYYYLIFFGYNKLKNIITI